jgi:hypothetical protein
MAKKFLVPIDLNQNELLNVRLQNLASDPSGVDGQMYFNTNTKKVRVYDASIPGWKDVEGAPGGPAGVESVGGTAPIQSSGGANPVISITAATTSAAGSMSAADKTKLDGVQAGATANATDSQLRDRSTHTGTQAASTISDFDTQVRTSRLDQMAAPTADVSLNARKITNLAEPTAAQDAATKAYVDATSQGLDVKASVRAATTANTTLSGTQTVDGVALVASDRVLVKNQTTAANNGIYVVAAGAWSRAADADTSAKVTPGLFVFVEQGTANADSGWVLTTDAPITLGTTALAFAQFSGAGQIDAGAGLTKTGNTLNVGAGTGIVVNADDIAIDTAVVVRKYAVNVGGNTSVTVTHNLNTRDVTVALYLNSGAYEEVEVDVEHTTVNTVTLRFATAPAANAYRCVVQG